MFGAVFVRTPPRLASFPGSIPQLSFPGPIPQLSFPGSIPLLSFPGSIPQLSFPGSTLQLSLHVHTCMIKSGSLGMRLVVHVHVQSPPGIPEQPQHAGAWPSRTLASIALAIRKQELKQCKVCVLLSNYSSDNTYINPPLPVLPHKI